MKKKSKKMTNNKANSEMITIKQRYVYLAVALLAIVIFIGGFFIYPLISLTSDGNENPITGALSHNEPVSAEPVSAEDIYPLFICQCCGAPLNKNKICCGVARDMIDHIDTLVDTGFSETDIVIKVLQKYGTSALSDEGQDMLEEIKLELAKRAPKDRPIITIEPDVYDFGDVSIAKGAISNFFTIKNSGKSDLIITSISTSCGCTTASLGGSRFFGMSGHGGGIGASPPGWTYKIPPGKTAMLEVKYDPNMHPDFRGAATRIIYISSNDPVDFQDQVRIELNQVS